MSVIGGKFHYTYNDDREMSQCTLRQSNRGRASPVPLSEGFWENHGNGQIWIKDIHFTTDGWTSRLYLVQKMVRLNYESGRSAWAAPRRGRSLSLYQFPFPNNSTVGSFLVLSNLRLQNPKVVKMGYAWNYIPSILFSPWDEKGTPIPRNSALWIETTHLLKR